jgi:type IV pilus assembly protein PilC
LYNFKYKGFDTFKGKKVKAYMEGYTREEILYKLNENNIECEESDVYEVSTDSFEYKLDKLINKDLSNPLKKKHLLTFTEQLSMCLSAKLQVSDALKTMASDSSNKVLGKFYQALYDDTSKGIDLSEALKKYKIFDSFFLTIVKAGEQSGRLDESLKSLNTYMKTNSRLRNKLLFASIYPALLLTVMLAGMIALSILVIPKFQQIFDDNKIAVNALTKFYFGFANLLRFHPILCILTVVSIIALILFWIRTTNKKIVGIRDALQLRNPIYNKFTKDREIAQFAFTLSILLKNGIPLTDALSMSKTMFKNSYVSTGLNLMHKNLMQGNPLTKELRDFRIFRKQFLPSLFIQLATVGDSTGNLEEPFYKVGDYFMTMFDNKASTFEKLIEPIMLLMLMPPIFSFVLAIFIPMIKMSTSL